MLERFGREPERALAKFDAFVDEGRKQPRRPGAERLRGVGRSSCVDRRNASFSAFA